MFRAVDGEGLGITGEPLEAQAQVSGFLYRTLGQRPAAPGLRSHQDCQGIERRVASHTDGRLNLREAAPRGLGGVGREQRRMLLAIGNMSLVGGRATGAHLCQPHHHFQHIHLLDDLHQFCRRTAAHHFQNLGSRHVNIHDHVRDLAGRCAHDARGCLQAERVFGDEKINQVKGLPPHTVHLHHSPVFDLQTRPWIKRTVAGDQAGFRPGLDKRFAVNGAFSKSLKTFGTQ